MVQSNFSIKGKTTFQDRAMPRNILAKSPRTYSGPTCTGKDFLVEANINLQFFEFGKVRRGDYLGCHWHALGLAIINSNTTLKDNIETSMYFYGLAIILASWKYILMKKS